MTVTVTAAYEGRLLRSLLQHTLGISTTALSRLKKDEEGILVNGVRVTVRYVLHEGDVVSLRLDDTAATATETVLPCEGPLDILYEDDSLIVLCKPAGMPTHPSHGHLCDTLANALAYRYAEAGIPFVFRPLGRLDRNTSGVVVCGKTMAAAGFLGNCLKERVTVKRYVAVLEGEMPAGSDVRAIEVPILQPAAGSGVKMRTAAADGTPGAEYALTRYRVLAVGGGRTLVLASPVTGRTHQLRVHFASLGFPLAGDDIYGQPAPDIGRHALHCLSLSLPMPFAAAAARLSPEAAAAADCEASLSALPPSAPLNVPASDGWLHTWAPLPADMAALCGGCDALRAACARLCPAVPTAADLRELRL